MSDLIELHRKKKKLDNQTADQIELLDYLETCEMCIFFIKKQLKKGEEPNLALLKINGILEKFERARGKEIVKKRKTK